MRRPIAAFAILAALLGLPSSMLAAAAGADDPAPMPTSAEAGADAMVIALVVAGAWGAGMVAIAALRRRHRRVRGGVSSDPADPEASTDARSSRPPDRRALRLARARLTDDPIVAALGVSSNDDRRRRRARPEADAANRDVER